MSCPGESCCCLCAERLHGRKHTHIPRIANDLQSLGALPSEAAAGHCVCRACELSTKECVRKRDKGAEYKLRWEASHGSKICGVPDCSQLSSIIKHPFSQADICRLVDPDGSHGLDGSDLPEPLALCSKHYQQIYRAMHKSDDTACRVCGAKRKHKYSFSLKFVPCPNPVFVQSFLQNTTGQSIAIDNTDLLCMQCYKYYSRLANSSTSTLSNEAILAKLKDRETSFKI